MKSAMFCPVTSGRSSAGGSAAVGDVIVSLAESVSLANEAADDALERHFRMSRMLPRSCVLRALLDPDLRLATKKPLTRSDPLWWYHEIESVCVLYAPNIMKL